MQPSTLRPDHLAKVLGLTLTDVFDISRDPSAWFDRSFKKRVAGKKREIDPPTRPGKRWLRRLARFIANELPVHDCAHGGIRERGSFTAARNHLGSRLIVARDIQNCFPSIVPDRFLAELIALEFSMMLQSF